MTVEYKDSKRLTAVSSDWETDTTSNITWSTTGKVGWDISSTTISRTGSDGWGTSKIQSTDTFTVGSGKFMIEFSGNNGSTMLGFNKGTLGYYIGSPQNQNDFSIYLAGGSTVEVYESGNKNYDSGGSRNASDKFRIEIDNNGVVKYYHQAGGTGSWTLKHTSSSTASGTYFIQANAYSSTSEATVHSKTVTTAGAKPSNVQDNSLLIEKDTTRRYWFSGTEWLLEDPTYETDFSSDSGWTMTNKLSVTGGNMYANAVNATEQYYAYYDLGLLSDTKWYIEIDFKYTNSGGGEGMILGVSSGTSLIWQNGGAKALALYISGAGNIGGRVRYNTTDDHFTSGGSITNNGTWKYLVLERFDVNTMKTHVYSTASDRRNKTNGATYTGSIDQSNGDGTDITSLRYLQLGGWYVNNHSSRVLYGYWDNIKVYDGVNWH